MKWLKKPSQPSQPSRIPQADSQSPRVRRMGGAGVKDTSGQSGVNSFY